MMSVWERRGLNPMAESHQHFDVIIVGARVAGSAAAILLGRQGRRVLLLDQSAFPSDTLSTHIVLGGGARVLNRIGVIGELERRGGYRLGKARTRADSIDFTGRLTAAPDSVDDCAGLCLGRARMDAALIEFARTIESVAVRERFRVTDLIVENGAVCGVRGGDSGAQEFRAPLTIGADGMRSAVARIASERLGAFARRDVPCARAYYYGYFTGIREPHLEDVVHIEFGPRDRAYVAARCEDGRAVVATAFDAAVMHSFRTDLTANYLAQIAENAHIAAMVEGATFAGRVYSSGLLKNTWRMPVCNGALLLGDSGLHVDPLFGQGHSFALISAEIMASLAPEWFSARNGSVVEAPAMSNFAAQRDAILGRHYEAAVGTSRVLDVDQKMLMAFRAANAEQWAADEFVRFTSLLAAPGAFPTFRFARLMARQARTA
jgi:flavin-dependent dehydrogenase